MTRLVGAELFRVRASGLWLWSLLAALVLGCGFTTLFTAIGPENFDPPLPGLGTSEGVRAVLGLATTTLFVPALIGAIAVTGDYRHQTLGQTVLAEPRRGRVLAAKLVALAVVGAGYALVVVAGTVAALYGTTALTGTRLGAPPGEVFAILLGTAAAIVAYTLIGGGIGALVRHQLAAVGVVLGYFAVAEIVVLVIPGVNHAYPYLPGGASAALTGFGYLTDAVAADTGAVTTLLSPWAGFTVLLGYAVAAAVLATMSSLRRDIA
ncbi:ABC transporter permease [Prauserella cavernicola]|uniref:ABC transporter permease n=1 Tax=Prauserella cavernicola TaxID=2800127 RepID=A0A934V2Q8_9PSEU|nr:ABC transporter permease [Prauserella cavernicola]MBK1783387.1 ABC transporter permease [Prauserella cavernicola]